jgi:hypothetical protein
MDTLKIWFSDFWPEWNDENFISPILSKHFTLVLDKNHPDIVFHSIFGGMKEAKTIPCKKRVLYLGENWRPGQFGANYSISFDPHSETNYRLPLWQVYILNKPELKDRLYNRLRLNLEDFERFCSFTVSNPNNMMRNGFFQQLNEYKRVHSYGKVLCNDFSLQKLSIGKYWRDTKDEFFKQHTHKFAIVFENTPYPGYTTEKLMDAFLAGSLPIYFGDPQITQDFNTDAFIHGKPSELIELVKQSDFDDVIFQTRYTEGIFTTQQKEKLENNLLNFEKWLVQIVNK